MLPAKPFYLIRHGESEANAARIVAGGQFDSPLNAKGRAQGQALAPYIERLDIKPEVIYHSSMSRARDTATFINGQTQLEMNEVHNLREHDLGGWDNMHWDEVLPRLENRESPPDGESQSQFAQRIQSTFTDIFEKETERLPMIVAHGGLFHALGFLYEYGMSHIENCHLHYFEPNANYTAFPWQVWCFDIEGSELKKKPAPFCLSQTMAKIA